MTVLLIHATVSVLRSPDNPQAAPRAPLLSMRLAHLLGPFGALDVSGWAEQVRRLFRAVFEPSLHRALSARFIRPENIVSGFSSSIWICIVHLPDLALVQPSIPVQPLLRVRDELPAFSEPLRIAAHSRPEVLQDLVRRAVESLSGPRPLCSGFAYPPRVQGPEFVEAIRSALARVLQRRTFRIQRIRIQGRLTRTFVRRTSRLGANRFAPRRDNTVLFLVMGALMLEKRWNLYVLTAVNLVANDQVLSGQLSQ